MEVSSPTFRSTQVLSFDSTRSYILQMKWLSILFTLLIAFPISAQQSIDLLTLSYRHGFTQEMINTSGQATENVLFLNTKVPLVLSDNTIWYNDLSYSGTTVNYSTPGIPTLYLHGFILQTGLVQKLNESTAIQLLFAPRLMTDFENVDRKHFQFGGIGLFEKNYHKDLTLRYGFMFNDELFGPMLVPLIYIDWLPNQKWSVNGLLPVFGKISYQVNDKFVVGLSHFGLVTSYQIGGPIFQGDYIERKSIDLSLFGRYLLLNNVHFESRIGYALGRSYEQYSEGDKMNLRVAILSFGDDRFRKNFTFDPGPIIDFRLIYNLPI